eukprot:363694-Chlamydomonas_euryale.AAC.16
MPQDRRTGEWGVGRDSVGVARDDEHLQLCGACMPQDRWTGGWGVERDSVGVARMMSICCCVEPAPPPLTARGVGRRGVAWSQAGVGATVNTWMGGQAGVRATFNTWMGGQAGVRATFNTWTGVKRA